MPRRVQDIIPGNRRTIRDIPVLKPSPTDKVKSRDVGKPVHMHKIDEPPTAPRRMPVTPPPELPRERSRRGDRSDRGNRGGRRKRLSWVIGVIGAVVVLAGMSFVLSGHLARATFNIVPRSIPVQVSGTYVIPAMATSGMPLSYGIITETSGASATVQAIMGAHIDTKATGTITLYNAYSAQSQRLVAGTRLADDSGLIYRLTGSVVIPGYSSSVGQSGSPIPGSIATTIVADQSGSSYNISRSDSISDFKIVAYKGTPKYAGFYARLSSDVTGGFSGAKSTVAAGVLASTSAMLKAKLLVSLLAQASSSIPAGYMTYPDAYAQLFSSPSAVSNGSTTALVTITGTLWDVIFKKSDFAAMLAGASSTASFGSMPYDTPGLDKLAFIIVNQNGFYPDKKTSLVAKISGSFKLVGSIPVDTLKKALAGLSLAKTGSILQKYASVIDIADSSGEIVPLWVSAVPSDMSRITVNIQKP